MIAVPGGTISAHSTAALRRLRATCMLFPDAATAHQPAPSPEPRPCAAALEDLLMDGSRIAWHDRSAHAARAFTQGNGFVPGQIVDRAI